MNENIISALILIAGVINFVPVIGIASKSKLEKLYGITIADDNTEILMRHRAVMFGLLGGFMIYAALSQTLQVWAISGGLISMITFIIFSRAASGYTNHIRKIVKADILGIICLLIAGSLMLK